MVRVGLPNAFGDGQNRSVILGIAPLLKIVAAHPKKVGKPRVTLTEITAERAAFLRAVRHEDFEVVDGLGGIEDHQ